MSDSVKTIIELQDVKAEEPKQFLEVELKYAADDIDRLVFKDLMRSLNPSSFIYVESRDVYYVRGEDEFLRYRMPAENKGGPEDDRSELTFKKKHKSQNNWVRTEVNLRIDRNSADTVNAFCTGLGYIKDFSIHKLCEIYFWDKVDVVYYSVKDESGKYQFFIEIEGLEDKGLSNEELWAEITKFEKLLAPLGITPQKRKKLSLFEMYRSAK